MDDNSDEKTWRYPNRRVSNYPPKNKQITAKLEEAYRARMDIVVKAEETRDFIPLKSKDSISQIEADDKDDVDQANRVGLWENGISSFKKKRRQQLRKYGVPNTQITTIKTETTGMIPQMNGTRS